jgi:hypothetical protein
MSSFPKWTVLLLLLNVIGWPQSFGQNLEGGLHAGLAVLGEEVAMLGEETGAEFGVWLNLWPSQVLNISVNWAYLPREDYSITVDGSVVGENDRNRQYVDVTLQYHFLQRERWSVFLEGGGGSLWNNRQVINPGGFPDFEEAGKESTRKNIWTVGGGLRYRLIPHLNCVLEFKTHSPGSESQAVRVITGLTVSLR